MKLQNTNPIGIGTFCLGGGYHLDIKRDYADYDQDLECIKAIQYSLSIGQNHIDTAYTYGVGHTEELVGQAIKGFDRSKIYLADKLPKSHLRRSAVIPVIKEMLRRLKTDYIDLMYVHDVNVPESMEGYLGGLEEAVDLGLIREIGISNANLEQTKQAVAQCKYPIAANQIQLNLIDRQRAPEALLNYCREQGIQIVAYQPLQNIEFFRGLQYPQIQKIARKYGKTVYQIGLNWLVKHKGVLTIPKAVKKEHITENFKSLDFTLAPEDLFILDSITND